MNRFQVNAKFWNTHTFCRQPWRLTEHKELFASITICVVCNCKQTKIFVREETQTDLEALNLNQKTHNKEMFLNYLLNCLLFLVFRICLMFMTRFFLWPNETWRVWLFEFNSFSQFINIAISVQILIWQLFALQHFFELPEIHLIY